MSDGTPTVKRRIAPARFTIVVEAHKVNEHGTFSAFEIVSIKGPNDTAKVSILPRTPHMMMVRVESLSGLKILGEADKPATGERKKLF